MRRGARRSPLVLIAVLAITVAGLPGGAGAQPIAPASSNIGCDPIDPAACLLPFPNDFFTTPDATTDTGLRVSFSPAAMPRNGAEVTEGGEGKFVDPTEWNRNDGFSPGSMVMTLIPGLDLHTTWGTEDRPFSEVAPNEQGYFDYRDHIADIGLYEEKDAPIVIINAETGERHPFWSELDTHPGAISAGEQLLILRPAANFEEGARYIVAMRDLKRTDGSIIEAGAGFAAIRDGSGTDATRQAHFDNDIFPVLDDAKIERETLNIAWDFTIASERNLSERMLHIRDDAFAQLGDEDLSDRIVEGDAPTFRIDSATERTDTWTDSNGVEHSDTVRRIEGRIEVPNYLDRLQQEGDHVAESYEAKGQIEDAFAQTTGEEFPGDVPTDAPAPGSRFLDLDLDGLPDQNPIESTVNVPFVCDVTVNGQENYMTLYGHGLLGTRGQIGAVNSPRRFGPFAGCAMDWWGMSSADLPTVAATLVDFSNFPSLPDRAQQGFLNFLYLGRAAVHAEGLVTDPAFQQDGEPLLKIAAPGEEAQMFYDGNSQGGIMGGALTALSPDITRSILGVPANNYSTLLNRSVDWEGSYAEIYYAAYQDAIERQIGFALLQMLWDRGEGNGFAAHMTDDPLPNTPPHEVMLQVAFADHQVSNHAAEVEGRTIGAPIMTPGLAPGRHWEMDSYFSDTEKYPYQGSALIYWDSGNATPPNGNVPADEGGDPHGHPRSEPAAGWQEAQFLLTGWMVDVCDKGYYLTNDNPLNAGAVSCHAPTWEPGTKNK